MTQKPKPSANPKDLLGVKKVPTLSVVPTTSIIYEAVAMQDGAAKYGPFNWRDHPVLASVYLDALIRHTIALSAGEWVDPLSGKPHAGHAKACLGILIDAFETGNLIDDRPKNEATLRLLKQYDQTPPRKEGDRALGGPPSPHVGAAAADGDQPRPAPRQKARRGR